MKHETLAPGPEGCEAIQQQLSEIADSGAAVTPAIQAHLSSCDACSQFAARWLQGPPAELARPVPAAPAVRLRESILDAAALPNVVPFPAPAVSRLSWPSWLGRLAACVALAGFSYWLLNPVPSPVARTSAAASPPTLTQSLTQMENRTAHEQAVVQTALVDGGRQVRGDVAWSVSALEL